ncbi:uncharacterized protein BCR38DRAFT_134281 [Pseudomassariella vexata]|uniref:Hemerythrin-like domain-containing protein n=1 Tax=Pseudomassariella vexata TaxID=1141098 RepID=A0A1Y2EB83_9PEZI|nr:uncharacterized protein BCR38DRAFT_134281 [Pseudomassariella vexata]ORY68564.1 hypothetical protein BCR38DRAFT_134281 [Pseudomassariella vexata]
MLMLQRIPRIFATLRQLRQPALVDSPRLIICRSTLLAMSGFPTQFCQQFKSAMSSCAAAETADTGGQQGQASDLDTAAPATTEIKTEKATSVEPKFLPLSAADFRAYNRMAEHMDMYHNHFRSQWNLLWNACTSHKRPSNMSLKSFIDEGLQFIHHLTLHHDIEETYIFPVLAKKMPEFKSGKGNGAAELLRQHKEIHKGLDMLGTYLRACKTGETEFALAVLKTKLDSWGKVLWTHLDQEVKSLGAENMRKYWTKEEIRAMPM